MRVTIINDGHVVVDGVAHKVDVPGPHVGGPDFHALQWDTDHGEVEFSATRCSHCGARSKRGNNIITDLAPYQKYIDAWKAAEAVSMAAAAERAAEEEAKNAAGPQG